MWSRNRLVAVVVALGLLIGVVAAAPAFAQDDDTPTVEDRLMAIEDRLMALETVGLPTSDTVVLTNVQQVGDDLRATLNGVEDVHSCTVRWYSGDTEIGSEAVQIPNNYTSVGVGSSNLHRDELPLTGASAICNVLVSVDEVRGIVVGGG